MTNIKGSIILLVFLLNGCSLILGQFGFGGTVGTAGESSVIVDLLQSFETAKTAGDIGSYATTKKTLTDHVISKYTGKDCRTFNILEDKELCEEVNAVDERGVKLPKRYTGFTCGTKEYSDWPCMDAEGCIVK